MQKQLYYTGFAWKHHIAEHFENGVCLTHPNGAGKGATIFTNYQKMIDYLKQDGRRWYTIKLKFKNEPLLFEFGNDYMATIQRDIISPDRFKFCL